jgi:predicted PurR-regulated permease PerM
MTHYEVLSTLLGIVGVLFVPLIAMSFRAMIRWVRAEEKLTALVEGLLEQQTLDRDQQKFDRDATNQRLQYLERWNMEHTSTRR